MLGPPPPPPPPCGDDGSHRMGTGERGRWRRTRGGPGTVEGVVEEGGERRKGEGDMEGWGEVGEEGLLYPRGDPIDGTTDCEEKSDDMRALRAQARSNQHGTLMPYPAGHRT